MGNNGQRLLILVVLAAVGFGMWQKYQADQEREARRKSDLVAGLRASEVLTATFRRAADLRVATLAGEALSKGSCTSAYMFSNEQQTRAPYKANYFVQVGGLSGGDYRWNAADRIMTVELPNVAVEDASVDMGRAVSTQSGKFISRACGLAMQQQIAGRLKAVAMQKAQQPNYLAEASNSARRTIEALTAAPLAAAGIGDVKVVVRLPGEDRPAGLDREQWDVSRPIEDVLREAR